MPDNKQIGSGLGSCQKNVHSSSVSLGNESLTLDDLKSVEYYVPGSVEKKRAVVMYILLGIIVALSKKQISKFEYTHLKQSIGRRAIFLLLLVISIVLLFIPVIRILAILVIVILIVIWLIFIKQARDGKYASEQKPGKLALFTAIGFRITDLFDISIGVQEE